MIIVTGSAGFIGTHLAESLKEHSLLLVDNPQHFRDRKYFGSEGATLWDWATGREDQESHCKIMDRAYFPKVLEKVTATSSPEKNAKENYLIPKDQKIDFVLHIGACTDTAESRKDFLDQWNVDYSKAIWNWCAREKVPLLYASSAATYGGGEHGFLDSWETTEKLKPLNAYGQSKQDFDLWVKGEIEKGNSPPLWYGLKYFNVFGEKEAHKGPMASPVLHSFRHIARTGKGRLFRSHNPKFADGEQSRDFIYVKDIVSICHFLMEKKPESGIYNCGTGKARTFKDLMAALFSSLGKPMEIEWVDTPEQYRKAYQYFTQAQMEKLRQAGYEKPFTTLEEAVGSYVSWLKENDLVAKLEPSERN